jgi:hypothetical protein
VEIRRDRISVAWRYCAAERCNGSYKWLPRKLHRVDA